MPEVSRHPGDLAAHLGQSDASQRVQRPTAAEAEHVAAGKHAHRVEIGSRGFDAHAKRRQAGPDDALVELAAQSRLGRRQQPRLRGELFDFQGAGAVQRPDLDRPESEAGLCRLCQAFAPPSTVRVDPVM